jgi:hypothetical protein
LVDFHSDVRAADIPALVGFCPRLDRTVAIEIQCESFGHKRKDDSGPSPAHNGARGALQKGNICKESAKAIFALVESDDCVDPRLL